VMHCIIRSDSETWSDSKTKETMSDNETMRSNCVTEQEQDNSQNETLCDPISHELGYCSHHGS